MKPENYRKGLREAGGCSEQKVCTADIKDLHITKGNDPEPFLGLLSILLKGGVEIRLIHIKEPDPAFREDFDRYKNVLTTLERMLYPRVF